MTLYLLSVAALVSTGLGLLLFFHYARRKPKFAHSSKSARAGFDISKPLNDGSALLHSDVASGTIYCAAIAIFLSLLFNSSEFKSYVPIAFLAVVLAIAKRFGKIAGSLGTAFSGLILAAFLFEPIRSLAVFSPEARINLGWMFLGGFVISYFFGRSKDAPNSD